MGAGTHIGWSLLVLAAAAGGFWTGRTAEGARQLAEAARPPPPAPRRCPETTPQTTQPSPPPTWLPAHGSIRWYAQPAADADIGTLAIHDLGGEADRIIRLIARHTTPAIPILDVTLHAGAATQLPLPQGRYDALINGWPRSGPGRPDQPPYSADPRYSTHIAGLAVRRDHITRLYLFDGTAGHADEPRPAIRPARRRTDHAPEDAAPIRDSIDIDEPH